MALRAALSNSIELRFRDRTVRLTAGIPVPVSRSRKNERAAAPDNLVFDSQLMSQRHAEIFAERNAATGQIDVFVLF